MSGFDRYSKFRSNGTIGLVPFIEIPKSSGDIYEVYKRGHTRLDLLSFKHYKKADFWWLILQANAQYGSMEFEIPDGVNLRIPYPLESVLETYQNNINNHFLLNGVE